MYFIPRRMYKGIQEERATVYQEAESKKGWFWAQIFSYSRLRSPAVGNSVGPPVGPCSGLKMGSLWVHSQRPFKSLCRLRLYSKPHCTLATLLALSCRLCIQSLSLFLPSHCHLHLEFPVYSPLLHRHQYVLASRLCKTILLSSQHSLSYSAANFSNDTFLLRKGPCFMSSVFQEIPGDSGHNDFVHYSLTNVDPI